MDTKWQKAYMGPFNRKEAEAIVMDLKNVINPKVNAIYDARIRKRSGVQKYDVYIKTDI